MHAPSSALSRRALLAAALLVAAAPGLWGFTVIKQALANLEHARATVGDRDSVRFEKKRLDPPNAEGVKLFQATRSARAVERFRDSYFAATDGGLVRLSKSGRVERRYGVLEGLGESDLTSLAAYDGRLYIGTRGTGLVAFDGERFERYTWPELKAQAVTALAPDRGKLLVGTFAGGLLEFDGEGFREIRAGDSKARLDAVTVVVRAGPRLFVGTFGAGLWVSEGGRWAHFTAADGLASNRVVGVVESEGEALVATDFGLDASAAEGLVLNADSDARRAWRTLATVPTLSGVAADSSGRVVLCKDDGETATLGARSSRASVLKPEEITWTKPRAADSGASGARLFALDGGLWMLGSDGVRRSEAARDDDDARASRQISFERFGADDPAESPTNNLVSALAFDSEGNLWAGSFREGVDLFAPDGARRAHLYTEELREVNALVPDDGGGVFAATSQGVMRLDSSLRPERLDASEVAGSGPVMHVAVFREANGPAAASPSESPERKRAASRGLVAATSRGLSLGAASGARALTTVQGLPSNSVYAIWSGAGRVYAGTLGGLAEVSAGRVVRVFKDSNSALANNWVTAVAGAGGRVFVGTYGAGVYELLPSGDLRGFAAETGRAFVNPNAMWGDSERLYVGTLDGALVLDLRTQKWSRVREQLPAPTVLSVAGRDGRIYFGTTAGLARFDTKFFEGADSATQTEVTR